MILSKRDIFLSSSTYPLIEFSKEQSIRYDIASAFYHGSILQFRKFTYPEILSNVYNLYEQSSGIFYNAYYYTNSLLVAFQKFGYSSPLFEICDGFRQKNIFEFIFDATWISEGFSVLGNMNCIGSYKGFEDNRRNNIICCLYWDCVIELESSLYSTDAFEYAKTVWLQDNIDFQGTGFTVKTRKIARSIYRDDSFSGSFYKPNSSSGGEFRVPIMFISKSKSSLLFNAPWVTDTRPQNTNFVVNDGFEEEYSEMFENGHVIIDEEMESSSFEITDYYGSIHSESGFMFKKEITWNNPRNVNFYCIAFCKYDVSNLIIAAGGTVPGYTPQQQGE